MEIAVYKYTGEDTGRKIKLSDQIFGIEPNTHAVYLTVKQYLANQRQGTHKSKERAEISGSTRKIKKQKGTGTARAGSIKSPIFRGGGTVFGPRVRSYSFKLNKKIKTLAKKSILASKAQESKLSVLEDFTFEKPQTKQFIEMLNKLSLNDTKVLLVVPEVNKNIYLSSRNLQKASVATVESLHTYQLIHADKVVFMEGAVQKLETILN